jgi:hypothetical protein
MKKTAWIIIVLLAILVGIIPINYLFGGVNEGYLELKSPELLRSRTWWVFLYVHTSTGGLSILIGWLQFSKRLLQKRPKVHRAIGKIYFFSSLICSISGLYIALYATGGLVPALGFMVVACIYFYTTLMGYVHIRNRRIIQHQHMMTYSYAVCLAAVSLRIMSPLSYVMGIDYILAYSYIAWFSWIPNLIIAYFINTRNTATSVC